MTDFWLTNEILTEWNEAVRAAKGNGCTGCDNFWAVFRKVKARLEEQRPPDGKEAEELRAGIETLMQTSSEAGGAAETVSVAALQKLLDIVVARDSLHYLQREDLARAAQTIDDRKLSVTVHVSEIASVQFVVADSTDDERKAVGWTIHGAVDAWLREYVDEGEQPP